jgi:hypothetical protein
MDSIGLRLVCNGPTRERLHWPARGTSDELIPWASRLGGADHLNTVLQMGKTGRGGGDRIYQGAKSKGTLRNVL